MQVIPVIDLKDGIVVHARQGQRELYQPMVSPLCRSSAFENVLSAYLNLHSFGIFYIADLNALENRGDNLQLIHETAKRFSNCLFWLDSGLRSWRENQPQPQNIVTVIGSESIGQDSLSALANRKKDFILSLDHAGKTLLGSDRLFAEPKFWPQNVILMTLDRVGAYSGPAFEILTRYRTAYPSTNFIAAGGIRHAEDLQALSKLGIRQALLASALHSGSIGATDLAKL